MGSLCSLQLWVIMATTIYISRPCSLSLYRCHPWTSRTNERTLRCHLLYAISSSKQLKEQSLQPSSTTYGLVMLACEKYNLVHEFFRKVDKTSMVKSANYKSI
ncbi:hypothetical protein MKX03_025958 [Papaver bracteatum]|nr:hypothetical protein MKX03_025958 [Papaver bracteatum]